MRSLPIESLAPVGVLFVAGLLLLAFGQRLLKPVLVVAAVFTGVVVAVRLGHAHAPTVTPLAWSIAGAFAGVLAVVVSYRLALGLAVGLISAIAAMLIATAAAELGLIDVSPRGEERSALVAEDTTARHAPQAGTPRVAMSDDAKEKVAAEFDAVSPGLGPSVLAWIDRSHEFVASVGDWGEARWNEMPRPLRTLLLAAGAAGAFLGFIAGLSSPVWAAAGVTSLFGALLVLACAVPLGSRFAPPGALPQLSPLGWLGTWAVLAAIGWSFQWWNRPQPKQRQKSRADAEEATAG
ncbi:MAG: hypothetical protein U0572_09930 [Phycisphaerales bacterium]